VSSANAGSNSSDTFLGPFLTTSASTTTESSVQMVVPVAGTIGNLAVDIGTAPGGGKSWTFTVHKTGADTTITCPMSGGGGNTTCKDNTHTASFAAGDLLSLEVQPAGTPGNWGSVRWSVTLTGN
jgi:hypothetical protein